MQSKFSELFEDKRRYRGQIVGDIHDELDVSSLKQEDLIFEFSRNQVLGFCSSDDNKIYVSDNDGMTVIIDIDSVEEITKKAS